MGILNYNKPFFLEFHHTLRLRDITGIKGRDGCTGFVLRVFPFSRHMDDLFIMRVWKTLRISPSEFLTLLHWRVSSRLPKRTSPVIPAARRACVVDVDVPPPIKHHPFNPSVHALYPEYTYTYTCRSKLKEAPRRPPFFPDLLYFVPLLPPYRFLSPFYSFSSFLILLYVVVIGDFLFRSKDPRKNYTWQLDMIARIPLNSFSSSSTTILSTTMKEILAAFLS